MIRLLLIEDDPDEAHALEDALDKPHDLAVDRAVHAAEATAALEGCDYDLVVLDLALPPDGRRLAPQREEGMRLLRELVTRCPGIPVIVLSGHADLHLAGEFTRTGGAEDLFGGREKERMVRFFPKEDLPDCVDALNVHLARLADLDTVRLDFPPADIRLSDGEQRALRIYTRRTGAVRAVLEPLGGGLSESKTLKLEALNDAGGRTALVAVKLGQLGRARDEAERFENVAGLLPVGLGAQLVSSVLAGAGCTGALCYRLADDYDRTLFTVVEGDDESAAQTVERLCARFAEWYGGAAQVSETVQDLRRRVVSDRDILPFLDPDEVRELRRIEQAIVDSSSCMQHGDLHGLNVLVDSRSEPVVIDYGDVKRANPALDPAALELSAIFHPDAQVARRGWPDEDTIRRFLELDVYLADCPYPSFVKACRAWAEQARTSEPEWLASAWAYAARQLKYQNPTDHLARVLMEAAGKALAP